MFVDSHLHIYDLAKCFNFKKNALDKLSENLRDNLFCASSCKLTEFEYTEKFCCENKLKGFLVLVYIHKIPLTRNLQIWKTITRKADPHNWRNRF